MILDTIYLFPLVGVAVKNDLLRAIVEGRAKGITLDDLAIVKYLYLRYRQNPRS